MSCSHTCNFNQFSASLLISATPEKFSVIREDQNLDSNTESPVLPVSNHYISDISLGSTHRAHQVYLPGLERLFRKCNVQFVAVCQILGLL